MSSHIGSVRDAIEKALYDDKHIWTKYFQMCEEKTGAKRINIFMGKFSLKFLQYIAIFHVHTS